MQIVHVRLVEDLVRDICLLVTVYQMSLSLDKTKQIKFISLFICVSQNILPSVIPLLYSRIWPNALCSSSSYSGGSWGSGRFCILVHSLENICHLHFVVLVVR